MQPDSAQSVSHVFERHYLSFTVSDDRARLDLHAIHRFLSQDSYWAQNVPLDVVQRSVQNSLVLGLYEGTTQVGFARIISDRATFAYLCDVFILPAYRGRGLSKWLVQCVLDHPDLQGLRKWMLATKDAHGLYAQFGFAPLAHPGRMMERVMLEKYPPA